MDGLTSEIHFSKINESIDVDRLIVIKMRIKLPTIRKEIARKLIKLGFFFNNEKRNEYLKKNMNKCDI